MQEASSTESIRDPTSRSSSFAELLRRFRTTAGLTQEELAERSGVSVRAISDLERGVKTRPQRATVRLLADGLGLDATLRAGFEDAVPSRHRPFSAAQKSFDLPVGGFLGALPETSLVARTLETAKIRDMVDAAAGGMGQLLLLRGEAGVGKTRLAQEATLVSRSHGMHVAAGQCYESQQNVPYFPFLEVFNRLTRLVQISLGFDPLERWPTLRALVPGLPQRGASFVPVVAGDAGRLGLHWSLSSLLEELSAAMKIALAIDDLHWSDQSSLDLLHHLAHQLRSSPVLIIGTYRDAEIGTRHPLRPILRDLHRERLSAVIKVGPLNRENTGELIAGTLGARLVSPEFVDLVHRYTQGNAFFVQEVTRALAESGQVYREDGVWRCDQVGDFEIPHRVQDTIRERLSRLSEFSREILRQASVLGETFEFGDLLTMVDESESAVDDALDEATKASIVHHDHQDTYSFNHVLTRQVLYRGLTYRRRKSLHFAAAEAIEQLPEQIRNERVAELSAHFMKGGASDRALPWIVLAGDQAEGRFAHQEAERFYRLAIDLMRDHGDTMHVAMIQEKLGETLIAMDRYDEGIQILEGSAANYRNEGDRVAEIRVLATVGQAYQFRGASVDGVNYVERMLGILEKDDDNLDLSALYLTLTQLYFGSGRYRDLLTVAERAVDLAVRFKNSEVVADAERRRATILAVFGELDAAMAAVRDVETRAEREGDLQALWKALATMGEICRMRGHFGEFREVYSRRLEVERRLGSRMRVACTLGDLGISHFFEGSWDEAETLLEQAISITSSSTVYWTPYVSIQFGRLRLAQGASTEGLRHLNQALVLMSNRNLEAIRRAHGSIAEHEVFTGHPTEAIDRLTPLLDESDYDECDVTELLPTLAAAYAAAGDRLQAERTVADALRRAHAGGFKPTRAEALLVRGRLQTSEHCWQNAERDCDEAVRLAREMPYPHLEGRALFEWGVMLSVKGQPEQARQRLVEALGIFERLGAQPYIERTTLALGALHH